MKRNVLSMTVMVKKAFKVKAWAVALVAVVWMTLWTSLNSMFGGQGGGGGFGRARRDPSQKYALDFEMELQLEFHEAVFGCDKKLDIRFKTPCGDCEGTGAKNAKA